MKTTPWWAKALVSVAVLGGAGLQVVEATEAVVAQTRAFADAQSVAARLGTLPQTQRQAQAASAVGYNQALTRAAMFDPWSDEQAASSPEHDRYLATNPGPLGRLRIPAIDVDLPINHDATKASMFDGVGHLYGTAIPIGGPGTHAVLAGHTGSSRRVFLDRLTELKAGDLFHIDSAAGTSTYMVDDERVVAPTDWSALAVEPGRDLVTLLTCHRGPDGTNWRLLVRGHRVPTPSRGDSTQADDQPAIQTAQNAQAGFTLPDTVAFRALSSAWVPWVQTRVAAGLAMVALWLGMVWSWTREKRQGR